MSVNTAGGAISGSGGNVSFSIGQVFFIPQKSATGSVELGVQHSYEIVKVGLETTSLVESIQIFPNPTTDNLTIQLRNYPSNKFSFEVYDMQGKLILCGPIVGIKTSVDFYDFAPATYLIIIKDSFLQQVQSFKINKF
ncbi:MAG: T9SS type A sorting domain-containing protein [Bacteroidia bacterium]|nr:T9SS type A sorting domain-containing protein [Bacteroidia bacterium]